ncbi:MAG TPA: glutamine synthetase family protein [Acidimicrobiales bacterium]|nr:glutamine synthetase family protein [Acidimicrobiales bacterium]
MSEGSTGLTVDRLTALVASHEVDTVVVGITDMQGRLQGKRFAAGHFLDDVVSAGTEGCNYLLAVDVDMNTVSGYAMSSWQRGYGDFVMAPDLSTLRLLPWHPGTAFCVADVEWADGSPVVASPRQILQRQSKRLAAHEWHALAATELEFIVFNDTFEQAWQTGYRDLTPANLYNVDYSLLGTGRVEPLLRRIRNEMGDAGMWVESAKGECNFGQHEIAFRYTGLITKGDEHAVFKMGAKEIASQEGCSLTFMAKYDAREGNSCHIHISLRDDTDQPVFSGAGHHGFSKEFEQFIAGLLATLRELTLFVAPNVNSYKRFVPGSFAPTALAWGHDNRSCALRIVGHHPLALRVECRVPGGDVNPYLALAAMVAGGLHGIEHELELEPEFVGSAYDSDKPRLPTTLREAAGLFAASQVAREAFGEEVVDHYTNMARVELEAFDSVVTDWERYRGFERL